MPDTLIEETTIPLLPCESRGETLEFYQALGFAITYHQEDPYPYGVVSRGGIQLHFSRLSVYGAKKAFGAYLVFVADVAPYHRAFADGLREKYGRVPTAGLPRISRLRAGHTRFKVFDPSGNMVILINRDEPEPDYEKGYDGLSEMEQAIENAVFLRDTYANDTAAANLLDNALKRYETSAPLDRARALAVRAELALALGEAERSRAIQSELAQLPLSEEDRQRYREELEAAETLERWLTQKP
jgi:hypothetical protein